MVIFVHSLGSLWQQQMLPAGGTRVWNTTGIKDGPRVRSCAKVFGQVKLGAKARANLAGSGNLTGATWSTTDLIEFNRARKLTLLCRVSRSVIPDLYLVTVTDALIGELQMDSWDARQTMVLSFSKWRTRQEVMLLLRPFAWLRGTNGSAVLIANAGNCHWRLTKW